MTAPTEAPGHTDLMVTPESMTPWLARDGAAKTICDFMGWPEDGVAFADAIRLAEQLGFKLLSAAPPTRTPEELESLLSLAMGALETFDRHARNFIAAAPDTLVTSITVEVGELRQASQVIAQIKGGQEFMASSARNEPQAGLAASAWRPIETAPRDGSIIDIWTTYSGHPAQDGFRMPDAFWDSSRNDWVVECENGVRSATDGRIATHWKPNQQYLGPAPARLPDSPSAPQDEPETPSNPRAEG